MSSSQPSNASLTATTNSLTAPTQTPSSPGPKAQASKTSAPLHCEVKLNSRTVTFATDANPSSDSKHNQPPTVSDLLPTPTPFSQASSPGMQQPSSSALVPKQMAQLQAMPRMQQPQPQLSSRSDLKLAKARAEGVSILNTVAANLSGGIQGVLSGPLEKFDLTPEATFVLKRMKSAIDAATAYAAAATQWQLNRNTLDPSRFVEWERGMLIRINRHQDKNHLCYEDAIKYDLELAEQQLARELTSLQSGASTPALEDGKDRPYLLSVSHAAFGYDSDDQIGVDAKLEPEKKPLRVVAEPLPQGVRKHSITYSQYLAEQKQLREADDAEWNLLISNLQVASKRELDQPTLDPKRYQAADKALKEFGEARKKQLKAWAALPFYDPLAIARKPKQLRVGNRTVLPTDEEMHAYWTRVESIKGCYQPDEPNTQRPMSRADRHAAMVAARSSQR